MPDRGAKTCQATFCSIQAGGTGADESNLDVMQEGLSRRRDRTRRSAEPLAPTSKDRKDGDGDLRDGTGLVFSFVIASRICDGQSWPTR